MICDLIEAFKALTISMNLDIYSMQINSIQWIHLLSSEILIEERDDKRRVYDTCLSVSKVNRERQLDQKSFVKLLLIYTPSKFRKICIEGKGLRIPNIKEQSGKDSKAVTENEHN